MARRAVSAAVVALVTAWTSPSTTAQFGGFAGRFDEPRLALVGRFDKDGDKFLSAEERKAALEFLKKEQSGRARRGPGPGMRGFGGPRDEEPPQLSP